MNVQKLPPVWKLLQKFSQNFKNSLRARQTHEALFEQTEIFFPWHFVDLHKTFGRSHSVQNFRWYLADLVLLSPRCASLGELARAAEEKV